MTAPAHARSRTSLPNLSLTGALVALSVGVLVPVLLSTSVGIAALVLGESSYDLLIGVLVVSFAAAALGGVVVVTWLLGRRARLARLQGDLLANVTHELRTPLSAIRMYAQTLLTGRLQGDPARTRESLEIIVRESEWLEAMIDRVLTWRSASRDRDVLDLRPEPLTAAVERAVGRFSRMVPSDDVSLAVRLESSLPVLHDREAVGSVVLNLLVNAYKYSSPPRRLRVELRDGAGEVTLTVEDNGVGIPRRQLRRVFDPFYRAGARPDGGASGAGLGLAIVRHLVHAQGGRVHAESEVGHGSRFVVRLPAAGEGGA